MNSDWWYNFYSLPSSQGVLLQEDKRISKLLMIPLGLLYPELFDSPHKNIDNIFFSKNTQAIFHELPGTSGQCSILQISHGSTTYTALEAFRYQSLKISYFIGSFLIAPNQISHIITGITITACFSLLFNPLLHLTR